MEFDLAKKQFSLFQCIIFGFVVVIITLLLANYYYSSNNTAYKHNYLYGMWIGDDDFNENAGVSSMLMFIGDPEAYSSKLNDFDTKRAVCLVIDGNEDIISKQIINMTYRAPKAISGNKYKIKVNMEYTENPVMPEEMTMEVNIQNGEIKLYDKETLYGVFYKDNAITSTCEFEKENNAQ